MNAVKGTDSTPYLPVWWPLRRKMAGGWWKASGCLKTCMPISSATRPSRFLLGKRPQAKKRVADRGKNHGSP